MIRLDITNAMDTEVGRNGVSEEDLRSSGLRLDGYNRLLSGEPYPFMELPFSRFQFEEIRSVTAALTTGSPIRNLVILGIGGSSLGTETMFRALLNPFHNLDARFRDGKPRYFILDNIDPHSINGLLDLIGDERDQTLLVVISKSGETPETLAQLMVFRDFLGSGGSTAERLVVITDGEKGALREIALREGYRMLSVPAGVGGRFSVLTPVGLFPAAVMGIDTEEVCRGAADMASQVKKADSTVNMAIQLASLLYQMDKNGKRVHVLMPYCDRLSAFADWFRQLEAESLGKNLLGPTPVRAIGVTDQHSQLQLYMEGPKDKCVVFLYAPGEGTPIPGSFPYSSELEYLSGKNLRDLFRSEFIATGLSLAQAKTPNVTIHLDEVSPYAMGALFYLFEMVITFMGHLYGVNPFDQPGVEQGKVYTKALMGKKGLEEKRSEVEKGLAVPRKMITFP